VGTLLALLDTAAALPMPPSSVETLRERYAQADLDFLREDLLKIIRSSRSGAARVKDIVSSLRSFSRLDEAVLKYATLESGLDDTLAILHHDLKGRIRVVRDYQLQRPVLCLPGQLNQVFMNILHNAAQAIQGPGEIRVQTWLDGDAAVVRIADDGPGIAPEHLGRIFDPFFTTKKVGAGTGLGLSISYGIVEKHGGRIEVESRPGAGTAFTIRVPLHGPAHPDQLQDIA
jgi:signal transduction histidine kinase